MQCQKTTYHPGIQHYLWTFLVILLSGLVFSVISRFGVIVTHETMVGITHKSGFCYVYLPEVSDSWKRLIFTTQPDDIERPESSELKVYEGTTALGPGHSNKQSIASLGLGRFTHWRNFVYFSSSDNSNPISNSRVYSVRYPMVVKMRVMVALAIISILTSLWLYRLGRDQNG